jgi:6-phosphofructokinase 1
MRLMKIGLLTGGGDCPGLNAVIRGVVRKSIQSYGSTVVGIRYGWAGLMDGSMSKLDLRAVSGILPRGGTILGTSRTNPLKKEGALDLIKKNVDCFELDALIAIGGDDTLSVGSALSKAGIPVIGVPKTIDNDISGTDYTFGFDTAVSIATEAIDRLHTTAESHNRIVVVEVMGRHTGWIAVMSGIAGGADMILIPEVPFSIDSVCEALKKRHGRGKDFSIVVVAEGVSIPTDEGDCVLVVQDESTDQFGHVRLGGVGAVVAKEVQKRTGYESRVTVLGYVQRGGTPTAFDRILGTRFGVRAAELAHEGRTGEMVSLKGDKIIGIPLEEAVKEPKFVSRELYDIASTFFG